MSWGTTTKRTRDRAWKLDGAAVVWSDPAMEGGRIRVAQGRRRPGARRHPLPVSRDDQAVSVVVGQGRPRVPDSGADADGGVPIVAGRARQGLAGPSRAWPGGKPTAPRHHSNRLRSRIRIGDLPATWLATRW